MTVGKSGSVGVDMKAEVLAQAIISIARSRQGVIDRNDFFRMVPPHSVGVDLLILPDCEMRYGFWNRYPLSPNPQLVV